MMFWRILAIMAILGWFAYLLDKAMQSEPLKVQEGDNHDLSFKDFLKGMALYALFGILVVLSSACSNTVKEKCGTTPDGDSYCVVYTN